MKIHKLTKLMNLLTLKTLCLFSILSIFTLQVKAQTYTTANNGNWNATATWVGGVVPLATATSITINHNVFVTADVAVNCNLTVNASKILTVNTTINFTVDFLPTNIMATAKFLVNGTFTNNGNTLVNGMFELGTSSSLIQNVASAALTFDGSDGTAAGSIPDGSPLFNLGNAITTDVINGTIQFLQPPYGANSATFQLGAGFSLNNVSNKLVIKFGGTTTSTSLNAEGFVISCAVFNYPIYCNNLILDNTTGIGGGQLVTMKLPTFFCYGNITIADGELRVPGGANFTTDLNIGKNLTNNGVLTCNTLNYIFNAAIETSAYNIGGSGTFRNAVTSPTANLTRLNLSSGNTFGVNLNVNNFTISNVISFGNNNAKLNLGTNNLIMGVGAATPIVNSSYPNARIVCDNTGKLIIKLALNESIGTSPRLAIGTSTIAAPISFNQLGSNAADQFSFRVLPTTGVNDATQCLNVMWEITEGVAGGNTGFYPFFDWSPSMEGNNFAFANADVYNNASSSWNKSNYNRFFLKDNSTPNATAFNSATNQGNTERNLFTIASGKGVLASGKNVISSTGVTNNWSQTSTWVGGVLPTANDIVNIKPTHTVNVDVAAVCDGLQNSGTLNFNTNSVTVGPVGGGKAFCYNSGTFNIGTATLNINGELASKSNINMSGGTINVDPNSGSAASSLTGTNFKMFQNVISTGFIANNITGNINFLDPLSGAGASIVPYYSLPGANSNTIGINYTFGDGVSSGGSTTDQFGTNIYNHTRLNDNLTINVNGEANGTFIDYGTTPANMKNLTLSSGILTKGGGSITGYQIYGDVAVNGNLIVNAPLQFSGTSLQTISGTGTIQLSTLALNNANNVNVTATNEIVNAGFSFFAGKLILNNTDVRSTSLPSSIGSATSYIVTNGTGQLRGSVVATGNYAFNIGSSTSSYAPIKITGGTGHVTDIIGVRVSDNVYRNGTTGTIITNDVVNKTWDITEAVTGGSNVTLTPQWSAIDELTGFTRAASYVSHYVSSIWDVITPTAAVGTGPYSIVRAGVTSFSPFAITSSVTSLPVSWLWVNAYANANKYAVVNWKVNETNVVKYELEKSLTGIAFTKIKELLSVGNGTHNYASTDVSMLTQNTYYRIKQISSNGTYTYSSIVQVAANKSASISIQPNPVGQVLQLANATVAGKAYTIVNAIGITVQQGKVAVNNTIPVANLPVATYVLKLQGQQPINFVKQ